MAASLSGSSMEMRSSGRVVELPGKSHRTKHLPSPTSIPSVETGECCSPQHWQEQHRCTQDVSLRHRHESPRMGRPNVNYHLQPVLQNDPGTVPRAEMVCHFLTSLSRAGAWRVATLLRVCGSVRSRSTRPARIAVIGILAGAHDRTSCVPDHAGEPAQHQHYQTDHSQPCPFTRDTGPDQRQCRHQDDDLCVQKIERVRAQPRV